MSNEKNEIMKTVTLKMTDLITGEKVTRTIDALNAYSNGLICWSLEGEDEQRANLERWITERGNKQHNALLELNTFKIS